MIGFYLNRDIRKMLASLLINVSSTYFIAAALTPAGVIADLYSTIINFTFNLFAATMYFVLAVKINKLYE